MSEPYTKTQSSGVLCLLAVVNVANAFELGASVAFNPAESPFPSPALAPVTPSPIPRRGADKPAVGSAEKPAVVAMELEAVAPLGLEVEWGAWHPTHFRCLSLFLVWAFENCDCGNSCSHCEHQTAAVPTAISVGLVPPASPPPPLLKLLTASSYGRGMPFSDPVMMPAAECHWSRAAHPSGDKWTAARQVKSLDVLDGSFPPPTTALNLKTKRHCVR
jgi:hypothetical protein